MAIENIESREGRTALAGIRLVLLLPGMAKKAAFGRE